MFGYIDTILVYSNQRPITTALYDNYAYRQSTVPIVVVYRREPEHTYGNEPARALIDKFAKLCETVLERKHRISREQKMLATSRLRRFGLPSMPEALFDKPTFVRRACGSRWRVMTP